MLQDLLIRPAAATAVPPTALIKPMIAPLSLEPGEPDLNESSFDNLAALADVAYRAGDQASAEVLIRRLYASYDRGQAMASVTRTKTAA